MSQNDIAEIQQRVLAIVARQAGTAVASIVRATHFRDDLNFDSLDFVELTMAVEEAFGISVPDAETQTLQTVGDVIDYVVGRTPRLTAADA